jgi:hypothetical protein
VGHVERPAAHRRRSTQDTDTLMDILGNADIIALDQDAAGNPGDRRL